MKNYQTEFLSQYISNLRISKSVSRLAYQSGNALYLNNKCTLISREGTRYSFTVADEHQDFQTHIDFSVSEKRLELQCNCKSVDFCSHKVATLIQLHEDISQELGAAPQAGMKYTREGMIKRVIAERELKANTEKYQIDYSDNMFGEHLITNSQNKSYKLTFYNFETKQGYCSCPDHQTNKLATCKHLLFAFDDFRKRYTETDLVKQNFPFVEVYLHPLHDYRVAWFFPGKLPGDLLELLNRYFDENQILSNKKLLDFQNFLREAQSHKLINIRPEVVQKVQKAAEVQALKTLQSTTDLNFADLKISLYPFQKEGVEFIVFNKSVILADEVGLGKTIQAILAAQFKKNLFNVRSTLIICPDSLIQHWEQEIQKAGNETSLLVKESADLFSREAYFKIIGFDDFMRLSPTFESFEPDMLIIDEAQKISNFDSDLVRIIRRVNRQHLLIITDSKPQNNLMQFYTMVGLIDSKMLAPLWEFSYQHCLFDSQIVDKVVGYYNQENIARRLQTILLRRENEEVASQLQKISPIIIPVNLKESQQIQQQKMAEEALFFLNKELLTVYDFQNVKQLLIQLKEFASLVLLPKQNQGFSAKFLEFSHFLLEKINITQVARKGIVFAEKEEARRQLIRFFKENHIPASLIEKGQSPEEQKAVFSRFQQSEQSAFIVSKEGVFEDLPPADLLIYYDFSLNQKALEKRYALLQQQNAIKPASVIHFINRNSLEYGLAQLIKENRGFFKEIALLLSRQQEIFELSDQAKEELKKIILNLVGNKGKFFRKSSSGQISLFSPSQEKGLLSLSGEEHKVFELPQIKKNTATEAEQIEKLLRDGYDFLAGLYKLKTGEDIPWKAEELDVKMEASEIVIRIKRK